MSELRKLFEEKWSAKVKTKVEPPEDLFASGSATDIAEWLKSSHKDLKSAMSSLNFYINRAGDNLSSSRVATLDNAKQKLHKMFKSPEKAEKE